MLNINDVYQAQETTAPIVFNTPLVDHSGFFPFTLYNKLENLQKTGSFKIRGAYNKISSLSTEELANGIICSSAGNHAQGVAYVAQLLNIPATIVMPKYASLAKILATKSYGAKVVLYGDNFEEAYNYALQLQNEQNSCFIPPFDDRKIIAGQAVITLEILDKLSVFDYLLVPIGGGGLIGGIAFALKQLNPQVKIIGVEAANAASMTQSLQQNTIVTTKGQDTFADGIAVRKVSELTLALCQSYVDEVITVSEEEINQALLFSLEKLHLLCEGAGAVGIAALLAGKLPIKKSDIVVNIVSGGNIDITLLSTLIDNGLHQAFRKVTFGTIIPDKPGNLNKLLELLADKQANVVSVNHDRYHHNISAATVYVEITIDTFNKEHLDEIFATLSSKGYDYRIKG